MHVLINAASANMGGAVTYLKNVLRCLPEVAPEDRFTAFVPKETRTRLAAEGVSPAVRLEDFPFADTGGAARFYFDQVVLPQTIRRDGVDVLFSSTGFGTWFSPCPEVLLVRNPVYFSRAFEEKYRELGRGLRRNTIRRWHSLASIVRADVVLFPTAAMQEMVEDRLSLAGRRTQALHYGFDHRAFSANGVAAPPVLREVERWRSEGYRILLNVSTYAVHKNFETLIEALPYLEAEGHRVKLLTTTSRDRTADKAEYDALMRRVDALGVRDAFVELGYVPYGALRSVYEAADAYVFPSFTESFGHSLVEAMAAGLPVVAADMPVNREVCLDGALYFPTYDAEACARCLAEVVSRPDLRAARRSSSLERARAFSWHGYAEQLMDVFRSARTPQRR